MGRLRFVTPETVRIDIGDGDWIEIKKQLTVGELRRAQAAAVKDVRADGRITPDFEMVGVSETAAYLVDWSLCAQDGRRVPIGGFEMNVSALKNMPPDEFEIISGAIAKHVDGARATTAKGDSPAVA